MLFIKTKSKSQLILERLRKGPAYNYQLNRIAFRYGAIIHDFRRDGYKIVTYQEKKGLFKYILISEPEK